LESNLSEINPEVPPQPEEASKVNWKPIVRDILETLVLSVFLFLVINAISARVRVDGFSMRPTLEDGQFVLVSRLAYRFGEFDRGDIIVFNSPVDPNEDLIKRVIGLPGDVIKVENGLVYVNGIQLNEPYIAAPPAYSGTWQVEGNQLFVLGDNRNDSSDSHAWGSVAEDEVIGKAILIYWPFTDATIITHENIVIAAPSGEVK
jgi:signal peptidase I